MAEEEESEINGGLASMDSTESRWVFQDEDDSEIEDDYDGDDNSSQRTAATAAALDSEDEDDNAEQRLIRTGPRIDSFDVEALEVPGAHRNDYEVQPSYSFLQICVQERRSKLCEEWLSKF
jgi:hypothetical protein